MWPADRAQLAVQAIVLRENGYRCEEGVAYYRKTQQRVRVVFDAAVIAETEALIREAWETAEAGLIPPPLEDSPKCAGMLAGGDLPAGRDAGERRRGGGRGSAATGAVRRAAPQAGEARGSRADDAAERAAAAVSEHARACGWARAARCCR